MWQGSAACWKLAACLLVVDHSVCAYRHNSAAENLVSQAQHLFSKAENLVREADYALDHELQAFALLNVSKAQRSSSRGQLEVNGGAWLQVKAAREDKGAKGAVCTGTMPCQESLVCVKTGAATTPEGKCREKCAPVGARCASDAGQCKDGKSVEQDDILFCEVPKTPNTSWWVTVVALALSFIAAGAFGTREVMAGMALSAQIRLKSKEAKGKAKESKGKAKESTSRTEGSGAATKSGAKRKEKAKDPDEDISAIDSDKTVVKERKVKKVKSALTDSDLESASEDEDGQQSLTFISTVVTLITGGLGAGILCLPWATAGAGIVPAIGIIIGTLVLNAWTIDIIVQAAERTKVFDLGALLGRLPNQTMATVWQTICNISIYLCMFFCLVTYMLVIRDSGRSLSKMFDDTAADPPSYLCLLVGTILLLPLCFLPADKLGFTSTLTIMVNVYIFGVILYQLTKVASGTDHDKLWESESPCIFHVGKGMAAMMATMMQCVIIQMCVLPMYGELEDRSPQVFRHVIRASFSGLYVLFASFAVFGVLAYGKGVDGNVLKSMGVKIDEKTTASAWYEILANGLMGIAICTVYPIMMMPMVAPIKTSAFAQYANPMIVGILVSSALVALTISHFKADIETVSVICGAATVIIFVGGIPATIGYSLNHDSTAKMGALFLFSAVMGVVGLMWTGNYPVDPLECYVPAWSS